VTAPVKQQLDVEVETSQLEGGQVELSVRVPPEPVTRIREQVLATFVRRASIPGFRKGKAPRAVVERHLDQEALQEQIIESLLEDAYEAALEKSGIKALGRIRIADQELTPDGALAFKAVVTPRPEIALGEYKGLKATRHITLVTDEQVEQELERIRARHARFTELPEGVGIEKSDLAIVDYEMVVDGEKREDAGATGYPLEVGADQLFPELNDVLVGARPGENRELEISYPESHADATLAGKTARFQVTVQQARRRQLPDLDDEFAKQVSDLETMEALRSRVRENLEAIGKAMAEEDVRDQLIRLLAESSTLDVPQAIVNGEVDRRIDEATESLERRNLTLHQYLGQINRSFEDWRADIEADARQTARRALILDEVGSLEKIEVTDEELDAEIHRIAESEHVDAERIHARLHDSAEMVRLANRIYHRKVIQFLVEHAEVSEEIIEPESDEQAEAPEGEREQPA